MSHKILDRSAIILILAIWARNMIHPLHSCLTNVFVDNFDVDVRGKVLDEVVVLQQFLQKRESHLVENTRNTHTHKKE